MQKNIETSPNYILSKNYDYSFIYCIEVQDPGRTSWSAAYARHRRTVSEFYGGNQGQYIVRPGV